MTDNFLYIDTIYRSRMTMLDILAARGYIVDKYRKFSPAEAAAASNSYESLSFKLTKEDPTKICEVRYKNYSSAKAINAFDDVEQDVDTENLEIIVMTTFPITEKYHQVAFKEYMKIKDEVNENGDKVKRKLRVSFFNIEAIVINPLTHVLVPKHEIVPEDQHKELMDSLYVTSKAKFPEIKFHLDPIARCIGAVPGDIIKITRPSASAGVSIMYRVCSI
jgi:DNA-directed RNA polymerase subunit H